jgi:N-methylhydantoinase B
VQAGDVLLYDTWGGGGCGDPLERDPARVQFDVDAGLVSIEGARRYGVVIKPDLSVDAAATAALRKRMAAERGPKKLFDRGFDSIDELKSRCLAETGLPPPAAPQFMQWARRVVGRSASHADQGAGTV